jgi:hypothetical protein
MENLSKRLVDKSIEAFIMGLEIYNKPTIRYRIEGEGFSFFICNAWELMLKAELLNRNIKIYYQDKPDRTISLEKAVKTVYPDENTRIRLNLIKIIDLRNIRTHYIIEDYEVKYAPLFQAYVLNFISEMSKFHNKDVTEYIAQNFLTISANYEPLTNEEIKLKYPPEIAEKFIKQANEIEVLSDEYNSDKFAINIRQNLYITKKKDEADFIVRINKSAENEVSIVKELKDPSDTHKYSFSNVVTVVQERLKKQQIKLGYDKGFNSYVLTLVIDFYNVKTEPKYAYKHVLGTSSHFTYSQQFIDFIVSEIKKDPQKFVESLRRAK